MTAPLGSPYCMRLGCMRRRHVSPTGIRYSHCVAHSDDLLSRAFGDSRQVGRPDGGVPRASDRSADLPVAVPAYRPAA